MFGERCQKNIEVRCEVSVHGADVYGMYTGVNISPDMSDASCYPSKSCYLENTELTLSPLSGEAATKTISVRIQKTLGTGPGHSVFAALKRDGSDAVVLKSSIPMIRAIRRKSRRMSICTC
jgi:hypothetical protein